MKILIFLIINLDERISDDTPITDNSYVYSSVTVAFSAKLKFPYHIPVPLLLTRARHPVGR